jgi:hypothetical protein
LARHLQAIENNRSAIEQEEDFVVPRAIADSIVVIHDPGDECRGAMEAPPRENGSLPKDEVVARLSVYLQCLGLPAADAQAKASAEVERYVARADAPDAAPLDSALADTIDQLDGWLEQVGEAANLPERCPSELLAWHLRPLLAEHPEVFLRNDDPVVARAAEAAAQASLPEPTPSPMPLQSFGSVSQIFQPSFWRALVASLSGGPVQRIKGE